jgi:hypothetical protein
MHARLPQRVTALALLVIALLVAAAAGVAGQPAVADSSGFAGMPTPEAFVAPTRATEASGALDASSPLYGMSVRLRAGGYVMHRFDAAGAVVAKRKVRFATARIYRTLANERFFNTARYVKLTSGAWAGWWVPAGSTKVAARTTLAAEMAVELPAGAAVGKRFFGPVVTRRVVDLAAPSRYRASERATFPAGTFYLLAEGPLAGRWVNAARVTAGVVAEAGVPTAAPSATPTTAPSMAPLSTWKTLALIYRDTDVTFRRSDGTTYRLQAHVGDSMYDLVRSTLRRTVRSVNEWSGGMAAMDLHVVDVPHALTKLDEWGGGYWVGPQAVEADLDRYAPPGTYDSVFVIWRARDASGVEVPVGGWGLTIPAGSWSNDAGFTSLITPSYEWWWTDSAVPEEVFVHEWLHQVIFFHQDAGRMSLDLHAGRDYGYNDSAGTWKAWYTDVMQGKVRDGDRLIGLSAAIWAAGKPSAP